MSRRPKTQSALLVDDDDDDDDEVAPSTVKAGKKPAKAVVEVENDNNDDNNDKVDEGEISMSDVDETGKVLTKPQRDARYKKKVAEANKEKKEEQKEQKALASTLRIVRREGARSYDLSTISFGPQDPFAVSKDQARLPPPQDEEDMRPIAKPTKPSASPTVDTLILRSDGGNKPPGSEKGEYVTDASIYEGLVPIAGWRRLLSPSHAGSAFKYKGRSYTSVIDAAGSNDDEEKLYKAARAKYTQQADSFAALIETQLAELYHGPVRLAYLEKLRDDLFVMSDDALAAEGKKYRSEIVPTPTSQATAAPKVAPKAAPAATTSSSESPHLAVLDAYEAQISSNPRAEFKHEFMLKNGKMRVITISPKADHTSVVVRDGATLKTLYSGQDYTMEGGRPRIGEEFENFVFGVWMADNVIDIKIRD